jgi:predicted nucleic acid-binding protein
MEATRGYQARATTNQRAAATLGWLTELTSTGLLEVLPFDRAAATVAGRIRALHPVAPSGVRRKGAKPEQRAGWVMDIQIAACTWTHGRDLATENRRDFERLRDLIAEIYPESPPLVLADPPAIA